MQYFAVKSGAQLPSEFGADEGATKLVETVKAAVKEKGDLVTRHIVQPGVKRTWSSPTTTEIHAAVPEDRVCSITWNSCLDSNNAPALGTHQAAHRLTPD